MPASAASDLSTLFYSCERLCSRKATLQEHQVEPAAELESHLVEMPGLGKAQALMQLDRSGILGIDPGDHDVLLHGSCPAHQLDQQRPADALAAAVGTHMNAVLHGIAVARPRAKLAETAEAGNARRIARDQEREAARKLCGKPRLAAFLGQFDLLVDGSRVADHFVIDLQDFGEFGSGSKAQHVNQDTPEVSAGPGNLSDHAGRSADHGYF